MAIVSLTPDACTIRTSVRSQIESKKELLKTRLAAIGKMVGATMGVDGEYPGWEYDAQSALRPVFVREYEKQTKKKAIVKGIHAGLECGIFATKAKESGLHLDFTSIGPDLREVHTPDENLGIASTGRTWELLKAVLAVLAEKGE